MTLHLSKDRKVAPKGYDGGTRNGGRPRGFVASIGNSFGLPAGSSCPGATGFCVSCYALSAEHYSPNVSTAMRRNLDALRSCGDDVDAMAALIDEAVGRFEASFDRTGLPGVDRVFRIHWDGDFFSVPYAEAWARVIAAHPTVAFWTYTRSFTPEVDVVPVLASLPNLALYLSTDEWNWARAHEVAAAHGVSLALCAIDYRTARELAAEGEYEGRKRPVVCPENRGSLPLMDSNGRGACVECRLCIDGDRDILFAASKVEDVSAGQGHLFRTGTLTVPVAIRSRRKSA